MSTSPLTEKEPITPLGGGGEKGLSNDEVKSIPSKDVEAPILYKHQELDLAHNAEGRIVNVLAGISKEDLYKQVEDFAKEYHLEEHTAILQKGALAAQSPGRFEEMSEFDENEKHYLRLEIEHPWKIPMRLLWTIGCCCVGAALQCVCPSSP